MSVSGGVSENKDITQEVRQGVLREDGILDKMIENKDYDPYKVNTVIGTDANWYSAFHNEGVSV